MGILSQTALAFFILSMAGLWFLENAGLAVILAGAALVFGTLAWRKEKL